MSVYRETLSWKTKRKKKTKPWMCMCVCVYIYMRVCLCMWAHVPWSHLRGKFLWVLGQLSLHRKFQDSQEYLVQPCPPKQQNYKTVWNENCTLPILWQGSPSLVLGRDGAGPLPPDDSLCLLSQFRHCQEAEAGRLDFAPDKAVHSRCCFPAPKLERQEFS